MIWWHTVKLGTKNLLLHKMRSVLTVLGVILGVGSVIAMLAIGEGSKREALERIRRLGASNVIIRSVKAGHDNDSADESSPGSQQKVTRVVEYGLKYEDYDRLLATLPTVARAVPVALVRREAQHGHRIMPNARILGTTPHFLPLKKFSVRYGRFLTAPDLDSISNVVVLGAGAAERLFSYEYPIGKPLLLGSTAYRIIGVLNPYADTRPTGDHNSHGEYDNSIFIPITAARLRFGELQVIRSSGSLDLERTQLNEITLAVTSPELVSQTAAMARKILEEGHPKNDDYEVQVPLELLRQAEHEKRIWNIVLGSIAGISLLVGGVGIMNIMLATVTERTREIGIRRALGAKRRDIIVQFLVESAVLSSIGGIFGILLGLSIPWLVTHLSGIQTVISWWAVVLAFAIAAGIGLIFGVYPARRAAGMDPIQALRHM
jgi:putative ABC transport system permease protein